MNLQEYWNEYSDVLKNFLADEENAKNIEASVSLVKGLREQDSKMMLIGNGGSAAIAEHMAIDFTKNARIKAMTLSGSAQITALANDYGYDQCFAKAIEYYAQKDDVLMAISSSGSSASIINAVEEAKKRECKIVTFSGFDKDNPLRQMGDINFFIESKAYGYVELIHNFLLHYMNDAIIGRAVYKFH